MPDGEIKAELQEIYGINHKFEGGTMHENGSYFQWYTANQSTLKHYLRAQFDQLHIHLGIDLHKAFREQSQSDK